MKFLDLNRAGGIGSNSCLIELGGFRFLIDAGLHPKEVGLSAMPDYEHVRGVQLDFIVLTHCHLDHLGSLPVISRMFPKTPVFTTLPNKILAPRMLRNSVNVMKRQRKELGVSEYPLFTFHDIDMLVPRLKPLRFEEPEVVRKKGEEILVTLYPSGHVAGAASVLIEHKEKTIYHTGDILFDSLITLQGARIPDMQVDVLITETTRGLTERAAGTDRASEWERLFASMDRVLRSGGTCLLPVFALGRLQEVLAAIANARKNNKLPRCPVFAGGLGMELVEHFDQITRETGLLRFRKQLIKDLKVEIPTFSNRPGSAKLTPGLYVLSSGMMVENTPSYAAAAAILQSDRNGVYFVGYCDPDTPGGKLRASKRGDPFVFHAYDLEIKILAEVDHFDLSGHADREELLDLIAEFNPDDVILTHGDPQARRWFQERILEEKLAPRVLDPQPGLTHVIA